MHDHCCARESNANDPASRLYSNYVFEDKASVRGLRAAKESGEESLLIIHLPAASLSFLVVLMI